MMRDPLFVALGLAALVFGALQVLIAVVNSPGKSWEQKKHKILGYRWFKWGVLAAVALIVGALLSQIFTSSASETQTGNDQHGPLVEPRPEPPPKDNSLQGKRVKRRPAQRANGKGVSGVLVKRVIRDAQKFQFLTLYADPENFEPNTLGRYWIARASAEQDIVATLGHLRDAGWHVGTGARQVSLEFQHVRLSAGRAEVRTSEQWYLPLFNDDGSPVLDIDPELGPFLVDYVLKWVAGHWLIESTTNPYMREIE
jgi:hypothetical protein